MYSYGGNTIPEKLATEVETVEDATIVANEWLDLAIKALDPFLPKKFHLTGHCGGCAMACMWAMRNPHRIEKLFLSDPGGLVNPSASFDPFTDRMNDETIAPQKKMLIKALYPKERQYTHFETLLKLIADIPEEKRNKFFLNQARRTQRYVKPENLHALAAMEELF